MLGSRSILDVDHALCLGTLVDTADDPVGDPTAAADTDVRGCPRRRDPGAVVRISVVDRAVGGQLLDVTPGERSSDSSDGIRNCTRLIVGRTTVDDDCLRHVIHTA